MARWLAMRRRPEEQRRLLADHAQIADYARGLYPTFDGAAIVNVPSG